MKNLIKTTFGILIFSLLFSTCSKEEIVPANDLLNGTWEASSFKINSIETIGLLVFDMTLEFVADDDNTGTTKWTIDDDAALEGYRIENNDARLILTTSNSEFDMIVTENTLVLDGIVDGDNVYIEAEK